MALLRSRRLLQLFIVTACFACGTFADQINDCQANIWRNLSATYSPLTPAIFGDDGQVIVAIKMYLVDIINLVERDESFVSSWLSSVQWRDPRLSWDPSNFSNCTWLSLPGTSVWLPDIDILNTHDVIANTKLFNPENRVYIQATGDIEWFTAGVLTTSCNLDLTLYPFDNQTCFLHIEAVSLVADNLLLIAQDNDSLDLSVYRENDLWQITSTTVVNNTRVGSSNLQFIMRIRRMPFYYIMNIAIPILVLSLLSVTVFWLPPNSGEKVSLSVTVFLSFTVFSVLIVSNLPVSSDTYPLLGIYSVLAAFYAALALLSAIVVLHIHHKSRDKKASRWFAAFIAFMDNWLVPCQRRPSCNSANNDRMFYHQSETETSSLSVGSSSEAERSHKSPASCTSQQLYGAISHRKSVFDVHQRAEEMRDMRSSPQQQNQSGSMTDHDRHVGDNGNKPLSSFDDLYVLRSTDNRSEQASGKKNGGRFGANNWEHMAFVLDKFFFWLFLIINLVTGFVCLALVPLIHKAI